MLNIGVGVARPLIYAAKLSASLLALWVAFANIRTGAFFKESRGKFFFNAAPALMILLTVVSPRVWEHHGVFLTLSFLVLLKTLSTEADWFLFIAAAFFEFIIPTFDFYPWSYVRMAAPLIVLWLLWSASRRDGNAKPFDDLNAVMQRTFLRHDAAKG
jgi:hypothetical protein